MGNHSRLSHKKCLYVKLRRSRNKIRICDEHHLAKTKNIAQIICLNFNRAGEWRIKTQNGGLFSNGAINLASKTIVMMVFDLAANAA
jgi:hypothetical protein